MYSIDLQGNRIDNVQNLAFANLPSLNHLDIRLVLILRFIDSFHSLLITRKCCVCLVSELFVMSSVSLFPLKCLFALSRIRIALKIDALTCGSLKCARLKTARHGIKQIAHRRWRFACAGLAGSLQSSVVHSVFCRQRNRREA